MASGKPESISSRVQALIQPPIAGQAVTQSPGLLMETDCTMPRGSCAEEKGASLMEGPIPLAPNRSDPAGPPSSLNTRRDHGLIASSADQAAFQRSFAILREVVSGTKTNRVGQHQAAGRSVFSRANLSFPPAPSRLESTGKGNFVGLINRRRFRFLLRKPIALLEGSQLKTGGTVHDAVRTPAASRSSAVNGRMGLSSSRLIKGVVSKFQTGLRQDAPV